MVSVIWRRFCLGRNMLNSAHRGCETQSGIIPNYIVLLSLVLISYRLLTTPPSSSYPTILALLFVFHKALWCIYIRQYAIVNVIYRKLSRSQYVNVYSESDYIFNNFSTQLIPWLVRRLLLKCIIIIVAVAVAVAVATAAAAAIMSGVKWSRSERRWLRITLPSLPITGTSQVTFDRTFVSKATQ